MKKLLLLALLLVFLPSISWGACTEQGAGGTYYVANAEAGTKDCSSAANACSFATLWDCVSAGDQVYMADGTYQGEDYMINPPSNLNGSSGNEITISATNDGEVLIDGEGDYNPIYLNYNDYFIIEGMNAKNGLSRAVSAWTGADHNIFRRIVAWDGTNTAATDANVFKVYHATNNTFEDCAGFGRARKVFDSAQSGNYTTIRRCWGWFTLNESDTGPEMALTMMYNNTNMVVENFIGTWDASALSAGPEPYGVIAMDGCSGDGCDIDATGSKLLGSIIYVESGAGNASFFGGIWMSGIGSIAIQDLAVYMGVSGRKPISLNAVCPPAGSASGCGTKHAEVLPSATSLTTIGDTANTLHGDWSATDVDPGATVNDVSSIWSSSNGAQVCYRYEDGVLGSDGIWPWPMDQRIYDALGDAGESQFYITTKLESLFGSIPWSECRNDHAYDVSPIDNATDVATDKVISWSIPSGADSVDVWFDEGTCAAVGGTTKVLNDSVATSHDPEGLTVDTSYCLVISSNYYSGLTGDQDEYDFSTASGPPVEAENYLSKGKPKDMGAVGIPCTNCADIVPAI